MFQITPHMRILLAIEPAVFRKGIDGFAASIQGQLAALTDYYRITGMDRAVSREFEHGLPANIQSVTGSGGEYGSYSFWSNTIFLTQISTDASFLHEMVHYWMDMQHGLNLRSRRYHEGVAWLMQHYYESGRDWGDCVGRVTSFSYGDDCETIRRKLLVHWPAFWNDCHSPENLTGLVPYPWGSEDEIRIREGLSSKRVCKG